MALIDLSSKFNKIKDTVKGIPFADVKLSDSFRSEYESYLNDHRANGYSNIEWAEFSAKITTSSGKVIFLTNFWFYVASQLSSYLEGLTEQRNIFKKIYEGEDLKDLALSLKQGISEENKLRIKEYFIENGFSDSDYEHFLNFVTDYTSWGGGKSIDRNDYYVSPLLQAGNLLAETQSAIAEIAKQFADSQILKDTFKPIFIHTRNRMESKKLINSNRVISKFIYDTILFLIKHKIEQPLFDCLIRRYDDLDEPKKCSLEYDIHKLTSIFKVSKTLVPNEDLESGGKPRFIKEPLKINSDPYLYYLSTEWTNGRDSRLDIKEFIEIFNTLYQDYEILNNNECFTLTTKKTVTKTTNLSKPFLLLAGISGTGKTRFVREQAKATGSLSETYSLTSVRPDWHEPSDILGYISRLGKDGAEYVATEVLQFIAKAWRAIIDTELKLQVIDNRLMVSGDQDELNNVPPYWLCLDEMNLAPVEQYFADYLSVLETREWCWDEEQFTYCCDSLLKLETIAQLANTDKLRNDLGFMESNYDEIWQHFCDYGMGLPFNLIVAGTVNMDETTHGFSRKVIDRALSFDFGEFFPNDFEHFFTPIVQHKALSYPLYSQATVNKLPDIDSTGAASIGFLESVNSVLDNTPFQLAFRALNELLLAVISNDPTDESELQAVWDDFLMHKVLPRIEGDYEKLALLDKTDSTSSNNEQSLLRKLAEVVEQQLATIWHETKDSDNARPDLYREKLLVQGADTQDNGTQNNDKVVRIGCRSKAKLAWMQERLERSGFTSFWP